MINDFLLKIIDRAYAAGLELPTGAGTDTTIATVFEAVTSVKNILVGFIYGGALLFFLIGVYNYITSFGNDAKAQKAKQMMLWAIVGLVVVIMAGFIVTFVANLLGHQDTLPPLN